MRLLRTILYEYTGILEPSIDSSGFTLTAVHVFLLSIHSRIKPATDILVIGFSVADSENFDLRFHNPDSDPVIADA